MNKVILIGNLTDNIDLRQTQNGKFYTSFSVAINEGYGEKKTVEYIDITAWEKTAELLSKYCQKGSKVCIEGRLKKDAYEKDGHKVYRTYVTATSVEFLSKVDTPKTMEEKVYDTFGHTNVHIEEEELPFY